MADSSTQSTKSPPDKKACWLYEMYRYESFKVGGKNDTDVPWIRVDPGGNWMGIPEMVVFNVIMGLVSI